MGDPPQRIAVATIATAQRIAFKIHPVEQSTPNSIGTAAQTVKRFSGSAQDGLT
jgi:hypothetical protein